MSLRINDTVPNFHAVTDQGEIDFHDFIGDSYTILFSHPADFTPICTTISAPRMSRVRTRRRKVMSPAKVGPRWR